MPIDQRCWEGMKQHQGPWLRLMSLSFLSFCSQNFLPHFRWARVDTRHCGICCQVLLVSHIALGNKTKLSLYNARWACSHLSRIWTMYRLHWSMLDIHTIMPTLVSAGQTCTIKAIRKCHYHFAQRAMYKWGHFFPIRSLLAILDTNPFP